MLRFQRESKQELLNSNVFSRSMVYDPYIPLLIYNTILKSLRDEIQVIYRRNSFKKLDGHCIFLETREKLKIKRLSPQF